MTITIVDGEHTGPRHSRMRIDDRRRHWNPARSPSKSPRFAQSFPPAPRRQQSSRHFLLHDIRHPRMHRAKFGDG